MNCSRPSAPNPGGTRRPSPPGPLPILHTAIYDAWADYDGVDDTRTRPLRRRAAHAGKQEKAISFAAHRAAWASVPGAGVYFVRLKLGLGSEFDAQPRHRLGYA